MIEGCCRRRIGVGSVRSGSGMVFWARLTVGVMIDYSHCRGSLWGGDGVHHSVVVVLCLEGTGRLRWGRDGPLGEWLEWGNW